MLTILNLILRRDTDRRLKKSIIRDRLVQNEAVMLVSISTIFRI